MRKILFCAVIIVTAPFVRSFWPLSPAQTSQYFEHLTLPLKLAQLSVSAPDQQLTIPVNGMQVSQIQNTWLAPRAGQRKHQGQDLFAPRDTEIYSATDGYVIKIGENPLGGNTVSILGAGGRIYYYAHLNAYAPGLSVGDWVTATTLLGYVGTTGNARGTPPHLHFGVYELSHSIDPLPLLVDRP